MPNQLNIPQTRMMMAHCVDAIETQKKVWGSPLIGILLTESFVDKDPKTIDQLACEAEVSHETMRRWIKSLTTAGRAEEVGHNPKRYCAVERWANWTIEALHRDLQKIQEIVN